MSDDSRTRIAAVLRDHFVVSVKDSDVDSVEACGGCGWQEREGAKADIQSHQADVLIRELKLDQPVDFTSVAWGITSFDNGTADD